MKTQQHATSNAQIVADLIALACALVFIAGLGYCFLFGFAPALQQSLTDDRYTAAISAFIAASVYLAWWFRQQS